MSTASDNTAKWAVRKFGGAGLPVGFEYFTTNPNIPAGSLPLLGGVYSRTLYKDLWNWVQEQTGYLIEESEWQEKSAANEGNVPFYSTGDGTTTFRVPSLKCWVKGANGIEEVGSYLSAGLPNITGYVEAGSYDTEKVGIFRKADTAFSVKSGTSQPYVPKRTDYQTGGSYQGLNFDASKSNSIYGNSDTVQPKSIVGMWLVKAYGTVTNVGSTDVSAIAQGLTELETKVTPILGAVRSVDGISADDNGNVNTIVAKGDNYVRFESGLQIVKGTIICQHGQETVVSMALPYVNGDSFVVNATCSQLSFGVSFKITTGKQTATTFCIKQDNDVSVSMSVSYTAIGWWK